MNDFTLPRWINLDQETIDLRRSALRQFLETDAGSDLADDMASHDAQVGCKLVGMGRHNTELAYRSGQRRYVAAATAANVDPYNPTLPFWIEHFTHFATDHATSSLYRHSFAIAALFFQVGLPSPTRTYTHKRLMRALAKATHHTVRHARPLYGKDLLALLRAYSLDVPAELRDLTICTYGATRGPRGATIVGVNIEDVSFENRGVILGLRREKTARNSETIYTGTPHTIEHQYCMPCVFKIFVDYLRTLGIDQGPLFRRIDQWGTISAERLSPKSVTSILRKGLRRANVADAETYSSHSFRHGLVVAARLRGWSDEEIMLLTMHRSLAGLQTYFAGLDTWYRSPSRSVLDGNPPSPPTSDQGWDHEA